MHQTQTLGNIIFQRNMLSLFPWDVVINIWNYKRDTSYKEAMTINMHSQEDICTNKLKTIFMYDVSEDFVAKHSFENVETLWLIDSSAPRNLPRLKSLNIRNSEPIDFEKITCNTLRSFTLNSVNVTSLPKSKFNYVSSVFISNIQTLTTLSGLEGIFKVSLHNMHSLQDISALSSCMYVELCNVSISDVSVLKNAHGVILEYMNEIEDIRCLRNVKILRVNRLKNLKYYDAGSCLEFEIIADTPSVINKNIIEDKRYVKLIQKHIVFDCKMIENIDRLIISVFDYRHIYNLSKITHLIMQDVNFQRELNLCFFDKLKTLHISGKTKYALDVTPVLGKVPNLKIKVQHHFITWMHKNNKFYIQETPFEFQSKTIVVSLLDNIDATPIHIFDKDENILDVKTFQPGEIFTIHKRASFVVCETPIIKNIKTYYTIYSDMNLHLQKQITWSFPIKYMPPTFSFLPNIKKIKLVGDGPVNQITIRCMNFTCYKINNSDTVIVEHISELLALKLWSIDFNSCGSVKFLKMTS